VRARSTLLPVLLILALIGSTSARARADDRRFEDARAAYRRDQVALMAGLTTWAALNVVGGAVLLAVDPLRRSPDPARPQARRAFGALALAYGLVNGALAVAALARLPKDAARLVSVADVAEERRQLSNVFAINVGLDMLSVGVGAAVWAATTSPTARGAGASVVAQGIFLVGFDTLATVVYHY
jgi:hypothetical protein